MKPSRKKPPTTARAAAAFAIERLLSRGDFLADSVSDLAKSRPIDTQARAAGLQLARGVARHLVTIEHVLGEVATFDARRVPLPLRAVLYVATYELIWLDQTPEFAIVDEAVKGAKRAGGPRAAGMVNAILRSAERAIESRSATWDPRDAAQIRTGWSTACRFRREILPAEDRSPSTSLARIAAATGADVKTLARLAAEHGEKVAASIAWAWQANPPVVLHRNPLRTSAINFWRALRSAADVNAEFNDDAIHLAGGEAAGLSRVLGSGWGYVQDSTAAAAASALGVQPGERVLDLCAAPGGKSIAAAINMRDRGEILACDVAADRLARVEENVQRLGLTSVRTLLLPRDGDVHHHIGAGRLFDAVLVDVPCSNSGVFARRPEARMRYTDRTVRDLTEIQSRLLTVGAAHTRVGGRLVYSTCSIDKRENRAVVDRFLAESPGWQFDGETLTLPHCGASPRDWRDGGYFARLILLK